MRRPPFNGRSFADTRAVLVPTDLTPLGRVAVEFAASLAAGLHAGFHVLHVDELGAPSSSDDPLRARDDDPPGSDALRRHTADLGWPVVLHHRVGNSAAEILAAIDVLGIDLVVMVAGRRRGNHELVEAKVWSRVLRSAPCPVLILPLDKRAGRVDLSDAFPPFSGESGL